MKFNTNKESQIIVTEGTAFRKLMLKLGSISNHTGLSLFHPRSPPSTPNASFDPDNSQFSLPPLASDEGRCLESTSENFPLLDMICGYLTSVPFSRLSHSIFIFNHLKLPGKIVTITCKFILTS